MRSRPSVTAVVPSRGRADFLARAVRSILGQRYEGEIECLVVFDGDGDSLPEVEAAPGRSLRAIRNVRTPGAAGARNTGALAALGEVVAFCDDDDEWLPDKVRRQIETLRGDAGARLVSSGIVVRHGRREFERVPTDEAVTLADLLRSRRAELHTSTFLTTTEQFVRGLGMFDESLPGSHGEDYELLLRAARRGSVAVVREPLVRVHWHPSSWFATRWDTLAAALTDLLAKYPEFEGDGRGIARIYGQIAFAEAAGGRRREARRWARRCVRRDWRQPRAYLAWLVSARLLSPDFVVHALNGVGKGI